MFARPRLFRIPSGLASERNFLSVFLIISLSPVASSVARLRAPKQRACLLVSVWQKVIMHLLQGRTLILSCVACACEANARQGSCDTLAYETFVLLWGASHSQMCCICRVGLRCLCKSFRDLPILVFTFAPGGIFGEMMRLFQSKQLNLASFFWAGSKRDLPSCSRPQELLLKAVRRTRK